MIGMVSASTIWGKDAVWHPSQSSGYYSFHEDQTDLGFIQMTGTVFSIPSFNFTTHSDSNTTLYNWTRANVWLHHTDETNITVCGLLEDKKYAVVKDGETVDIRTSDGICLNYNVTSEGLYNLQYPVYLPVEYDRYVGNDTYVTGFDQSLPFRCHPRQTGCVPTYQTASQFLYNYTMNETGHVYLTLNESVKGYTIRSSSEGNRSDTVNLSTTRARVVSASGGETVKLWFWIDTFYPFQSWHSTIGMEVADG